MRLQTASMLDAALLLSSGVGAAVALGLHRVWRGGGSDPVVADVVEG